MASPQKPSETGTLQPVVKTELQPPQEEEMTDILERSVKVGTGAGVCGLLFGATAGIVRGAPPILFALTTGGQWFSVGSSFWGVRHLAMARHGPVSQVTPSQKVEASFIAGACSGALVGGILRGPRNILPAALVFSLLGAGSQFALNKRDSSAAASRSEGKKTGWSPATFVGLRKLPDQEYQEILEEKILKIEVNIALVDDNIAALEAQRAAKKKSANSQPTAASTNLQ